jgi:TRAP-type C4-dicarboxylate transport system permease small subunit
LTSTKNPLQTIPVLRFLDKGEEAILCLLLATMIILACLQIVLRTFFSSGLFWADPLLRYLVLWCGLLGAVSATSQGKHIALDLTGKRLSPLVRSWVTLVTYLFCTLAAAGLTWAAWLFLGNEIEFGSPGPLALPTWFWNAIFPVAFGLITIKYVLLLLMQIKTVLTQTPQIGKNLP